MRKIGYAFVWLFVVSIPTQELHASVLVEVSGTISRLIGIAATLVAIVVLIYDGRFRHFGTVHIFIVLYFAWGCITYLWSADQMLTISRLQTNLQLMIMVIIYAQFAQTKEETHGLMTAYVLGASLSFIGQIRNMLVGVAWSKTMVQERYTAFDNDPNDYALALSIAVPLAWYLVIQNRSRFSVILGYFFVVFGTIGVIQTGSRGGLLSVIAGLLIIPASFFRIGNQQRFALVLVFVLGSGVAVRYVPAGVWNRLSTFEDVTDRIVPRDYIRAERDNADIRLVIWQNGLTKLLTDPKVAVVGVGAQAFVAGVDPIFGERFVAHNVFISVLVEQGIVGIILFLAILYQIATMFKHLEWKERYGWFFSLLAWTIGVQFVTWEHTKNTWFLLGLLAARSITAKRTQPKTHGILGTLLSSSKTGFRLRSSATELR